MLLQSKLCKEYDGLNSQFFMQMNFMENSDLAQQDDFPSASCYLVLYLERPTGWWQPNGWGMPWFKTRSFTLMGWAEMTWRSLLQITIYKSRLSMCLGFRTAKQHHSSWTSHVTAQDPRISVPARKVEVELNFFGNLRCHTASFLAPSIGQRAPCFRRPRNRFIEGMKKKKKVHILKPPEISHDKLVNLIINAEG